MCRDDSHDSGGCESGGCINPPDPGMRVRTPNDHRLQRERHLQIRYITAFATKEPFILNSR